LVASLVFASGCSALIFQVAWMRELRLIFGATTAAAAAVTAIFMAGLGVGSAVLGKHADRIGLPLRMYGWLEVGIALTVAISPFLISLITAAYVGLGGQESLGLAVATFVRLALAAAMMAIPTFLMGGTLPAAVRAVTAASDEHRRALAVLYGANTLGAVCGAGAATFVVLERLGTRATLWSGCGVSLLVGIIAIVWSRQFAPLPLQEEAVRPELPPGKVSAGHDGESREVDPRDSPLLIYVTAALVGFTFFALELVWYRMLTPILGGTTFTFGLILCVALLGIGVGGLTYDFIFRRRQPTWTALAITCGCEALFTIVPFALGDRLALMAALSRASATSFSELITGWSNVAAIVVLPVALISGVQFPLLIALLGRGRAHISQHLGTAYAWNTMGAIAGSLVGGFGAMPLLGALGFWRVIAALLAAWSIVLILAAPRKTLWSAAIVAGLAIFTVGSIFSPGPTAVWRHSGIGIGRTIDRTIPANAVRQWSNEYRQALQWETDGIESSIAITSMDGLSLIVNGKSDGNALNDSATQVGMAVLGAVLHKDPKTALVIGLGTGETVGWLAEMRGIERVDVVEPSMKWSAAVAN
jgi:spermidine synthase